MAGKLAVVFDPLDGSRNIEVSIPTGTIFGVYGSTGKVRGANLRSVGEQMGQANA
jgi:fructose-1,6-bisphosphatase